MPNYNLRITNWIFGFLILMLFLAWFPQRGELPLFWYDEAVNVRLSRNLAEQGYLNLQTAPGVEYEKPYQFQTSGYPLTAPLALLFRIFGFNFELARVYMFGWFTLFLLSAYLMGKRLFASLGGEKGNWIALAGATLLATFPPIFYHGLSIIGEIPGITFILLSAYFLERKHILSGLCLGFALATKPIFGPVILAAILAGWKLKWTKKEWLTWAGATVLPIVIFALVVLPSGASITDLISTYASRANNGSVWANLLSNLSRFAHELSLVHIMGLIILLAFLRKKIESNATNIFLIANALLMFLFFLQSSGWHRYLLSTQVILLFFLPLLIYKVIPRFALPILLVLVVSQGIYALTRSELAVLRRPWAAEVEKMIETYAPTGNIYVITSAEPAALIPSERLYFYTRFEGKTEMPNKLANLKLEANKFDYIISKPTNPDLIAYQSEVDKYYALVYNLSGLALYRRIK
ncbi:MAG TPA: hypothetical protein VJK09_01060 [Candidatus Paceibacterota bacterium]